MTIGPASARFNMDMQAYNNDLQAARAEGAHAQAKAIENLRKVFGVNKNGTAMAGRSDADPQGFQIALASIAGVDGMVPKELREAQTVAAISEARAVKSEAEARLTEAERKKNEQVLRPLVDGINVQNYLQLAKDYRSNKNSFRNKIEQAGLTKEFMERVKEGMRMDIDSRRFNEGYRPSDNTVIKSLVEEWKKAGILNLGREFIDEVNQEMMKHDGKKEVAEAEASVAETTREFTETVFQELKEYFTKGTTAGTYTYTESGVINRDKLQKAVGAKIVPQTYASELAPLATAAIIMEAAELSRPLRSMEEARLAVELAEQNLKDANMDAIVKIGGKLFKLGGKIAVGAGGALVLGSILGGGVNTIAQGLAGDAFVPKINIAGKVGNFLGPVGITGIGVSLMGGSGWGVGRFGPEIWKNVKEYRGARKPLEVAVKNARNEVTGNMNQVVAQMQEGVEAAVDAVVLGTGRRLDRIIAQKNQIANSLPIDIGMI
jgi:hypothetical protein